MSGQVASFVYSDPSGAPPPTGADDALSYREQNFLAWSMMKKAWPMINVVRAMLVGLAMLALISATAPPSVLTLPVSAQVSVGDPDLYVALAVLDPHIAAIQNRHVLIAPRPFKGSIDWTSIGPDWNDVPAGRPSSYDVTETQLSIVEKTIVSLGFQADDVHGWIVHAPVGPDFGYGGRGISSIKIGEIFVRLGPVSRASQAIGVLTTDASKGLRLLEAQAHVFVAFDGGIYYKPDCGSVTPQVQAKLDENARGEGTVLERALQTHLRLLGTTLVQDRWMLCPDVHPVTIASTNGWYSPTGSPIFDGAIVPLGTARYEIGEPIVRPLASASFKGEVRSRDVWSNVTRFTEVGPQRYVASTSTTIAQERPTAALLAYLYEEYSRPKIDADVRHLGSIGVPATDVFSESLRGGSASRLWIRVVPATRTRSVQIDNIMRPSTPYGYLALFTSSCTGFEGAVAASLKQTRGRAEELAGLLHAQVGAPLSVHVDVAAVRNATCGYLPDTPVEKLARAVGAVDDLSSLSDELSARFPVRVDAAWSLSGNSEPHIPTDREYTKSAPGPSCAGAEKTALQEDIEAAERDYGGIWSLLVQQSRPEAKNGHPGECQNVEATITVLQHP